MRAVMKSTAIIGGAARVTLRDGRQDDRTA